MFWSRISSKGLQAMRASSFLFIRKFSDQPNHTDGERNFPAAFMRIVLGQNRT